MIESELMDENKKLNVKEQIAGFLEENRGEYISGEQLAKEIGVSRAAVCKAVKRLKEEGFLIEAVTNKGYKLADDTDVLSENVIKSYLTDTSVRIEVLKSVSSTNTVVKERAGEAEGLVIAAMEQTGGMGRLGRKFCSPSDTGIYFSILLKPQLKTEEVTLLTTIAALSVCEAIEKCSDKKPGIKWVNDVFVDEKKVCGILTQASFGMENLEVEYVVVGIGINVYMPEQGFPDELKNIAGAVFEKRQGNIKNRLLAETLNSFFRYYRNFADKTFVDEYRNRSIIVGRKIKVIGTKDIAAANGGADGRAALAIGIDDDCRLLVRYESGEEEALSTGEISIRRL